MRDLSVRGARRLTWGRHPCLPCTLLACRVAILARSPRQYVDPSEQAQRSNGAPLMCLARQPVRSAGSGMRTGRLEVVNEYLRQKVNRVLVDFVSHLRNFK